MTDQTNNKVDPSVTAATVQGEPVAPETVVEAPLLRAMLGRSLEYGLLIGFILLCALLALVAPVFLTPINLLNVALQASVVAILAFGQTFVILSAGIDLSVGSVLVFGTVVSAKAMSAMGGLTAGWGTVLAGAVICLLATAFWGLVNGLIVTVLRVPPLIATLGTLGMALGAAQLVSSGLDISAVPHVLSQDIGYENIAGVPLLVVIAVIVAAVAGLVLWQSGFGVHTKAIGSNPEGGVRTGLAVRRHLVMIYTLSGVLAGVAGFMSLAEFSTTTIGGHTADNLTTIAGAVLGGTSLFGGVATIFGTVIGILVPVTLSAGFVITGVLPFWQTFAVGAVLVAAVYVDQLRRGAQNRR